MVISSDPRAALVTLNRFGLGAKPGDLAAAAADPRGFLLEELDRPGAADLAEPSLASSTSSLQALFAERQEKRRELERSTGTVTTSAVAPASSSAPAITERKANPQAQPIEQKLFHAEALARFEKQTKATAGFVERLVAFWSNHFAISAVKAQFVRVSVGPFEREAIRPHALGRFSELLEAAESHPAMLYYLDNQRSVGTMSTAGRFAGRGLNENLAREILELHTLGVNGGYSQADVTALARIITGWSFVEEASDAGQPGDFVFKTNWHEPGAVMLLGKTYQQEGRAQGVTALADIARHEATATHIATKLTRHFVAEVPPPPLVDALATTFRDTDGDLRAVAEALVRNDLAWGESLTKIRTPIEFLVATARAANALPSIAGQHLDMLNAMGMPLWQPPGPNGFADSWDIWAAPAALKSRVDVAWQIAQKLKNVAHPLSVLDTAAGLAASRETTGAILRAATNEQALAILLLSPEMQRR